MSNLIVLKFGSSVLRSVEDIPNVVHEINRYYRHGYRVIAVVSAIGRGTEELLALARGLASTPEPWAAAELLATGERTSAALLGIALDRAGVPARVVNPREIGLEVAGAPLDGEPVSVNAPHVHELLRQSPVMVVPGFFGTNTEGRTQLLGRGGSDFTAVFLAMALSARCRLLKDVDGVYDSDPARAHAHPHRYAQLGYEDALRVAGKLIQPKAVEYLRTHQGRCEVAALALPYHTEIHPGPTRRAPHGSARKRGVVILGLGTVGLGVYQRLRANPDQFDVLGILVREAATYQRAGVPSSLLYTSAESIDKLKPTLVIDALPGNEPSLSFIEQYLAAGVDVVSANKAVIATSGRELMQIATQSGATLRYSAAIGGGAPMLEAIDRLSTLGEIQSIEGVLNGTCNFLLDACAAGASLADAVKEAQRLGFAEADPTEDLMGRDASRKLTLLARHAFGVDVPLTQVEAFDDSVAEVAKELARSGLRLRQVARAVRIDGDIVLSVAFEPVGHESPFYLLSAEWNALEVGQTDRASHTVRGRGAGRWPTTESVMADIFDLIRSDQGHPAPELEDRDAACVAAIG